MMDSSNAQQEQFGAFENTQDLQFDTSFDTSVQQNVPIPPPQPQQHPVPVLPQGNIDPAQPPSSGSNSILSQSAHPIACVFHCLFKGIALFIYIFGGWFAGDTSNFITLTVVLVLLLAMDFWVVKNITGRLLVGLRWWNKVDGDTTRWIFESNPKSEAMVNKFDHWIFWTVLYVTPLIWAVLFLGGLLKFAFGWLIPVSMGMALSGANLYGYWKCSSDQKAKFQQMVARGAEAGMMGAMRSGLFTMLAGGSAGASGNAAPAPGTTTYV